MQNLAECIIYDGGTVDPAAVHMEPETFQHS
jgi:hypothetical protein